MNLAADKRQKALREHDDLRWAVAVLAERLRVSEGLRHLCREARKRCPRCVERMHGNLVRALKGVKPASDRAMKADARRAANEKRQAARLAGIVKSCKDALGVVPRSP